jgi:hypothetical protein
MIPRDDSMESCSCAKNAQEWGTQLTAHFEYVFWPTVRGN